LKQRSHGQQRASCDIPASASAATGQQRTSEASVPSFSISPTQQKVASIAPGKVNARSAMTVKIIIVEFVLPTALAIGLGLLLSIGANYLTERYLGAVIDLLT
jgi:hypothetical protein